MLFAGPASCRKFNYIDFTSMTANSCSTSANISDRIASKQPGYSNVSTLSNRKLKDDLQHRIEAVIQTQMPIDFHSKRPSVLVT